MTIEEIMQLIETPQELISELKKGREVEHPEVKKYVDAINPKKHAIFDLADRPDKIIKEEDGRTRTEKVARIALALQRLIVNRSASFMFGNPVEIILKSKEESHKALYESIISILEDAKINSLNRKVAKAIFSCTEVAELWYPVPLKEDDEKLYGIESGFKLRMKILNPMKGELLFPYFDDYGDMIAFSREYSVNKGGKKRTYFETYTAEDIYKFDTTEGTPVIDEEFPKKNPIGKIPIVYARKDKSDFEDVQDLIERLEKRLSNFADTNDYHGSPTIFIQGKVLGFSKKGESGKIIEGDKDATAEYLSWTNAPESVKLEIETLLNLIHMISQTPNISFENVKGLGAGVSGKALKMMFLDAHLKVQDNMEVFDEYLQRRMSIIKSYIVAFAKDTNIKKEIKRVVVENIVTPFMIDDEADKLEIIMTATGNKPVLSQKTGVKMAGYSLDSEDEYNQIKAEQEAENSFDILPTGM